AFAGPCLPVVCGESPAEHEPLIKQRPPLRGADLANRRLQPLGHLSNVAALEVSATQESGVPPCCSRAIQRMSRSGQRNPGSTSSPFSSPSGATVETVPSAR